MKKYYYDKNKALKQNLFCLGVNLDEKKLQNYVIYEGEKPFSGYPIVEGNILRQATLQELISLDKLTLKDGEKIEDNRIVKVPQPAYYYRWNKYTFTWEIDESLLKDGEYIQEGQIIKVEYDESLGYLKRSWNKTEHIWYESATEEEVKIAYCDLIIEYQNQVMEAGFIWAHQHSDGSSKTHIQRVRQGIDIPILETAISSLADARAVAEQKSEIPLIASYPWSFDDLGEDICELNETELRELRLVGGGVFAAAVYETCKILKQKEPSLNITLDDFLTELEKHTNISALLNKGDEIN